MTENTEPTIEELRDLIEHLWELQDMLPRTRSLRVHLRRPPDADRASTPACTLPRPHQKFVLTNDPEQVNCHHCLRIMREASK